MSKMSLHFVGVITLKNKECKGVNVEHLYFYESSLENLQVQ